MKIFLLNLTISCLLCGCASKSTPGRSSGPYYYLSGPSEHAYEPPGDLTEREARVIAAQGTPYYVAYFDSKGKPDKILKVSAGETEVLLE